MIKNIKAKFVGTPIAETTKELDYVHSEIDKAIKTLSNATLVYNKIVEKRQ